MKKFALGAAMSVILSLPAMALAVSGACVDTKGTSNINPPLHAVPVSSATFTFGATNTPTCAGSQVWAGGHASGTLTEPSCNGNVTQGKTDGGAVSGISFQGVCVLATCDGVGVLGGQLAYELVFDAATVQDAVANCDPAKPGLGKASFTGAFQANK